MRKAAGQVGPLLRRPSGYLLLAGRLALRKVCVGWPRRGSRWRMARRDNEVVRVLLERYGRSYAAQAGIRLADRPAPLYQLLVLSF